MSILNIITNQNINKQLSTLTFRSGLISINFIFFDLHALKEMYMSFNMNKY